MQLARVIGTVVSTTKDAKLTGITLLLVQPIAADRQPAGRPLVVRGKEASFPFYPVESPVDAGIVGIVDHWDHWDVQPVSR
jgi:microcompartment protein CcmK/EutM